MTFNYNSYIDNVVSGKILTGEPATLAVKRHLKDLERQNTDEFPFYFDETHGQKFVKFASLCRHWKGEKAGKSIELEPWQQFHIVSLFGWKRSNGSRRFRTSYTEVARKNGKTTLTAVKALAHLKIDNEAGAQVYFAATKEDQARIGFGDVQKIVNSTPGLDRYFKVYQKSVIMGDSFMKPLGSDSNTQDGYDPSYGIIDEYHAHPDSHMLNVIESGMGSRLQPLIDIITTAGFNRQSPCYTEVRRASIEVLKGIKTDDTHLAMIYTLDDTDDWENQEVWIKSNPNLGVSVRPDFLKDRYLKAKNEGGSKEVDFKTKNLNIWTDVMSVWIPDDVWMKNTGEFELDDLNGEQCYIGLDLASTKDITSMVLFFPFPDGRHIIVPYFFIPELTIDERVKKDGVNYDRWVRMGLVEVTPGNVTDYGYIRKKINELSKRFNIRTITYDRWNSSQLVIDLVNDGLPCAPFGQGFASMSAPTKELEKLATQGALNHGGNEVLRWMCSNVAIKTDPAGNIKIDKSKSSEKVDGMVALVMAIGGYMALGGLQQETNYEIILI